MLSQTDLAHEISRILHAFYWVMMDILGALEEAADRVNEELRFHLMLASKRCNVIVEHLRIALEEAGIKPNGRLGKEELRKMIGTLSIETLECIKDTLKILIDEMTSDGKCDASWLSSKLMEFSDTIYVASGLLKALSDSLKESKDKYIWRTCLILQTIAQDLEVIANTHYYLASNLEILAKDLRTK